MTAIEMTASVDLQDYISEVLITPHAEMVDRYEDGYWTHSLAVPLMLVASVTFAVIQRTMSITTCESVLQTRFHP